MLSLATPFLYSNVMAVYPKSILKKGIEIICIYND
jgi:hypothetical protein